MKQLVASLLFLAVSPLGGCQVVDAGDSEKARLTFLFQDETTQEAPPPFRISFRGPRKEKQLTD